MIPEVKPLEIEEAIAELTNYQKWRRGADIPAPNPASIGLCLDNVIRHLRSIRYGGLISKQAVIDKIEITAGAMILDGYEPYDSCVKYINELKKDIEDESSSIVK